MRIGTHYSDDELVEMAQLHERTTEAAEEIESSILHIMEKHKLIQTRIWTARQHLMIISSPAEILSSRPTTPP